MAPDANRAGTGASTSGTAKDEAAAKKKIESEDLVSRTAWIRFLLLFHYLFNGSRVY